MLNIQAQRFVIGLLLLGSIAGIALNEPALRASKVELAERLTPPPKLLKYFTFGHRRSLSAALWLHVLTWYGGGHIKDRTQFLKDGRNVEYLIRQSDFIIQLDPYFPDPYRFAALNLMWWGRLPHEALRYLRAGMVRFPEDYQYPFYYGFIHYYFLKDNAVGSTFLFQASKLPEAPPYFALLASKLRRESAGTPEAIASLKGLLESDLPDDLAAALREELVTLEAIQTVEQAVARFKKDRKAIPTKSDLLTHGYLQDIPVDAMGVPVEVLPDGTVSALTGGEH